MIEFTRYTRLKPLGLAAVVADGDGVFVDFARFDVEVGRRLEPERCRVTFVELAEKRAELERDLAAVNELLAFKPAVTGHSG